MCVNIQTLKDVRFYLVKELEEIYPEQEISAIANIIIKTVIGVTKLHHLNNPDHRVTQNQTEQIKDICKELKTGKPVQYILGETIFYDCIIKVNNATLIPRPETEELVDFVIRENKDSRSNIVDFGTGSGCIAIALAANIPGSVITGIDISEDAIRIARENARLNNVIVSFFISDIFNFNCEMVTMAEIIVSNPPYVRNSEKRTMNKNVLDFEPPQALFVPDSDPLKYYKGILKVAESLLLRSGKIYFEINEAMGKSMIQLFESSGYTDILVLKDINNKERIIRATKNV